MNLKELFADKEIKPSQKSGIISGWITDGSLPTDELIVFAEKSKDPVKASCIEALEYVTSKNPSIADEPVFDFAVKSLSSKAPRVKWESARLIANIVHMFPDKTGMAINPLIENTTNPGTVVRWSAAQAISAIAAMKTKHNEYLIPAIQEIIEKEEKNSIRKIYLRIK